MESSNPSRDTAQTMSEENVELLKGIFSAYEGLDLVAFMRDTDPADLRALYEAIYDPDIEIVWVDTSPDSGPFHGIDEATRAFEEWLESFEEFSMTVTEFLDAGDEVVVHLHHARPRQGQRGTGRDDGLLGDRGQGRQDRESARVLDESRCPRSRRAVGIAALDEKRNGWNAVINRRFGRSPCGRIRERR
jgi:ketosteroid isomerase-like protein